VDATGHVYHWWKSDENSPAYRTRPRIWSQRLSDDGLSVVGEPSPQLTTDRDWEGPLIEGPSMVRDGNTLFLILLGELVRERRLRHRLGALQDSGRAVQEDDARCSADEERGHDARARGPGDLHGHARARLDG
jgi:hypothetical protein